MKKALYILLLLPVLALGQTTTQNYVRTYTYKDSTAISDPNKANASIIYYDGLGRPIQQIAGKASASGKDIITHIEYDIYGRQPREYLPYPGGTTGLEFLADAKNVVIPFYQSSSLLENTANPYSEKQFEASPLNRVLKQAAPGNEWSMAGGKTVNFTYATNGANEILKFTASATFNSTTEIYDPSFISHNHYPAGQLYKTITTDENGVPTREYKNKEGQVVCKVGTLGSTDLYTYYVYDQYGNLTYVLPPAAEGVFVPELCYQYKYDYRNRVAEKKIPGKGWEYIVYDTIDRVVATGPVYTPFGTSEPTDTGWLHTFYDNQNRVCFTAWSPEENIDSGKRKDFFNDYWDGYSAARNVERISPFETLDQVVVGYNVKNFDPIYKLLTVNYYDDYNWPATPVIQGSITEIEDQDVNYSIKGLLTGTWDRVLTDPGETLAHISCTLYDNKYRPVRTYTTNYLSGFTETDTSLDFAGVPQYSITRHKSAPADTELVTREDYTYTPQDRLLTTTHQIGSGTPELIHHNTYEELGQLKSKKVGGTDITGSTALQKVDYTYNIRGWLKGINDIEDLRVDANLHDLFAFKINYNGTLTNDINGSVKKLYNGNIAETYWLSTTDNILRAYGYKYDKQNRLLDAYYQMPNDIAPIRNSYYEHVDYDKNGNITGLVRYGDYDDHLTVMGIDDLTYVYDAVDKNKLLKVIDSPSPSNPSGFKDSPDNDVDDYTYDDFGNMISDRNKDIAQIYYNHLNLPTWVRFSESHIAYLYTATGIKVRKQVYIPPITHGLEQNNITHYLGGYQYLNGHLQYFPTAEGYVDHTKVQGSSVYNYIYQYKDHLGNIRMNYTFDAVNGDIKITEESHYYPFGLKHRNYNNAEFQYREFNAGVRLLNKDKPPIDIDPNPFVKGEYNYKFQGKELQDELGLNMYDYGARNYDPALGRWMNIDPLAEKSRRWSPYNYGYNNPVRFTDPDGMLSVDTVQDMWNKSADGENTTWTNTGNGVFSNGTDTVDASDEAEEQGRNGGGDDKKKRQEIVNNAKKKDKSTEYAYDKSKDDFDEDTNKCNKFVYDILKKSGVAPPLANGHFLKKIFGAGSPITAGQWADPNYHIPGWEVVTSPQAGDVVAISANFSDATGHVAIMISNTESMGAGHNEVHVTDFGSNKSHFSDFPGNKGYVYRRYVGGGGGTAIPATYVNPAYKQYP